MKKKFENIFKYHAPKEGQPIKYEALRAKAKELAYLIDECCPDSNEKSLSISNLQMTIMLANSAIAINE